MAVILIFKAVTRFLCLAVNFIQEIPFIVFLIKDFCRNASELLKAVQRSWTFLKKITDLFLLLITNNSFKSKNHSFVEHYIFCMQNGLVQFLAFPVEGVALRNLPEISVHPRKGTAGLPVCLSWSLHMLKYSILLCINVAEIMRLTHWFCFYCHAFSFRLENQFWRELIFLFVSPFQMETCQWHVFYCACALIWICDWELQKTICADSAEPRTFRNGALKGNRCLCSAV